MRGLGRITHFDELLEVHPTAFVADALTRRAEGQHRFEIGEAAERQPRNGGDSGAKDEDESGLDSDLEGAPGRWCSTKEPMRKIEVFVHPDQQGDEDKPKRF